MIIVQHRAAIHLAHIELGHSLGWGKRILEDVETGHKTCPGTVNGRRQQKITVIRQGLYGRPIMRLPKVPLHANLLSMGGRTISTEER